MNLYKLFTFVFASLLVAILLANTLNNFTRIADSALADIGPTATPRTNAPYSITPANRDYLPIIFLNSATGGGAWLLSGNVGTNPSTDFLGTTDAQPLVIKTNGVERMSIYADGGVRIGSANSNLDHLEISSDAESPVWIHSISPNKATGLQIISADNIYRHLEFFYNGRSTPLYGAAPGDAVINSANYSNLILSTADQARMTISHNTGNIGISGNLGIGTSNPTLGRLEIASDNESDLTVHPISANKLAGIALLGADNERHLELIYNGRSTPVYGASSGDAVINSADYSNLVLSTADQARMTILHNGGNIGIGTTNPQSRLQVVGNYIQFPTISGGAPPASDCNSTEHYGRVVVRTDGSINLYVCTASGWVGK